MSEQNQEKNQNQIPQQNIEVPKPVQNQENKCFIRKITGDSGEALSKK